MATILLGPEKWWGGSDEEGNREWFIRWKIAADHDDGPAQVIQTAGLPLPGTSYALGNDEDDWAWCRNDAPVEPEAEDGEPTFIWRLTQRFSTKRPEPGSRQAGNNQAKDGGSGSCADHKIENPLDEPQRIYGDSSEVAREERYDRFGETIETSAGEPIRGPAVTFDDYGGLIFVEQNVLDLEYDLCMELLGEVNDDVLWDFPARHVKLKKFSWERKYYGLCLFYYVRKFTFEILQYKDPDTGLISSGHDRILPDEGNLVLRGEYERTPGHPKFGQYVLAPGVTTFAAAKPGDIVQYIDFSGNATPCFLDGHARPWDKNATNSDPTDDDRGRIYVERSEEVNFLLLAIPTEL